MCTRGVRKQDCTRILVSVYNVDVDINPLFLLFGRVIYARVLSASKSVDIVEKFFETKSSHVFRLKILLHQREVNSRVNFLVCSFVCGRLKSFSTFLAVLYRLCQKPRFLPPFLWLPFLWNFSLFSDWLLDEDRPIMDILKSKRL